MAAIDRVADVTLSTVLDPVLQDGANVPVVADLDTLAACSDGVILAVPNALHAPMAIALLEAGCPVLVEKPLAGTAAEGAQMVDAAERTGVPLLVGRHRRHNPLVAKAKEIVDSGVLERFQFSLKQGYRQCPESAEGVAGYWRSNINWKRFNSPSATRWRLGSVRLRAFIIPGPPISKQDFAPVPRRSK